MGVAVLTNRERCITAPVRSGIEESKVSASLTFSLCTLLSFLFVADVTTINVVPRMRVTIHSGSQRDVSVEHSSADTPTQSSFLMS